MPCYYPLDGWKAKIPNPSGKYPVVFDRAQAQQDEPLKLPCGKCIGCRLENSRQWAMRCVHEAQLHDENCFITLTYSDDNLPHGASLNKRDLQLFWKKLRKKLYPLKISYFACGEYGTDQDPTTVETLGRPHYHAIIFGYDFPDKAPAAKSPAGEIRYASESLTRLWGKGHTDLGSFSFESAAYVARYQMKKINGEQAEEHYKRVDPRTGEITWLNPEYMVSSRNPAIGKRWFQKYHKDLDKGFITMRGVKMQYPKYYDDLYRELDDATHQFMRDRKRNSVDILDPDNTLDRLRVKEKLRIKRTKTLKREIQ